MNRPYGMANEQKSVDDITLKEGEATITWFQRVFET